MNNRLGNFLNKCILPVVLLGVPSVASADTSFDRNYAVTHIIDTSFQGIDNNAGGFVPDIIELRSKALNCLDSLCSEYDQHNLTKGLMGISLVNTKEAIFKINQQPSIEDIISDVKFAMTKLINNTLTEDEVTITIDNIDSLLAVVDKGSGIYFPNANGLETLLSYPQILSLLKKKIN